MARDVLTTGYGGAAALLTADEVQESFHLNSN